MNTTLDIVYCLEFFSTAVFQQLNLFLSQGARKDMLHPVLSSFKRSSFCDDI